MNRKALWTLLLLCLVLGLGMGFATRTGSGDSAREAAIIRPVDDAWRAALPRDPEAATQAYMDRIPPAARARSEAYFTGGTWLQVWGALVSLASFGLLLGTGASAAMRGLAERLARRRPLQTFLYGIQFSGATLVLGLPLAVAGGYAREHRYGMTAQSFGPWLGEQALGWLVATLLGSLALVVLYGVLRRRPRTWWIWGAGTSVVLLAFAIFISPVAIDPLFNRYTPLPEGPARQAILSLARASGVPARDVFQFDASKQTNRVSANVSGLFGTASVRLNDNLLRRSSLAEVKAVMAHELGHYVLNHLVKALLALTLLLGAGFAFLAWAFDRLPRGRAWGIRDVGDPAGLPLLAGLLTCFMFLSTPVLNTLVRSQEMEADLYGVNASQEPDGFAEAQLKLVEYRKADPGPVEEFLFFDHPSPRRRILAAMRWRAEHLPEAR